jgi:hypothetical protein
MVRLRQLGCFLVLPLLPMGCSDEQNKLPTAPPPASAAQLESGTQKTALPKAEMKGKRKIHPGGVNAAEP